MPKVERKVEINASQKRIFDILDDAKNLPVWNLAVNEIKELKPGKYSAKTTVGDTISTRLETIPLKKISMKQEGGPMKALGYLLNPKGKVVEVTIWSEFDNAKLEKALIKAGELFLTCLKKFAEYLEKGGNPKDYNKKDITIPP